SASHPAPGSSPASAGARRRTGPAAPSGRRTCEPPGRASGAAPRSASGCTGWSCCAVRGWRPARAGEPGSRSSALRRSGGGPRYGNCRISGRRAWRREIVVGELGPERLVVAVLTYRRPDRIAALVPVLVAQAGELARSVEGVVTSVLVVDNDAAGTGAAAVEGLGAETVVEPEPGISA